jgi:hypothetical protein
LISPRVKKPHLIVELYYTINTQLLKSFFFFYLLLTHSSIISHITAHFQYNHPPPYTLNTTTKMYVSLLTTTLLLPVLAAAASRLGGIDMNRACADQYGSSWGAYLFGTGCNAWKCYPLPGQGYALQRGVDTPRACSNQYGGGAYALCYNGEYDWSCYRN